MNSFLIDNTDIDLKDELRKEVYQRALGSSIGHIILIFLFYVSSINYLSQHADIFLFLLGCLVINCSRLIFAVHFKLSKELSKFLNTALDITSISSGMSWGVLFILVYLKSGLSSTPALSLYVIISGVSGGAIASLAALKRIFISFTVLILVIPGLMILFHETDFSHQVFGVFFIFYSIFQTVQANETRRNIISKIRMNHYLEEEKEKIEELFNSMPGIICYCNKNGEISFSNSEWKRYYSESKHISEIDYRLSEMIFNFANSNEDYSSREEELGSDFNHDIFFIVFKKLNHGKGIITSMLNVTHIKKTENELSRQKELLQHSTRMIELGEMVGGIAHEVNNPLAIASGKLYLLKTAIKKQPIDFAKADSIINEIEIAYDRIIRIIDKMKSISRKSENDPFSIESLKSILDVVYLMTSTKLKARNISFINSTDNIENIFINCRPSQLEQVLINLINNAADAIENYETKWIKLEVVELDTKVQINIIDCGNGIPAEIQAKIWDSFFTTKSVGKGTGLGLSIAKQIIDSHNGYLAIDNDSANTKFTIVLEKAKSSST